MSLQLISNANINTKHCIPLFQESVSAGFPSPAQDFIECALDLNQLCITHPAATFFVRVKGESMINFGIYSGDILVVNKALTAIHNDIIVASVNDEYTVKQLSLKPPGLIAHNPAYKPIWLNNIQNLEVFGVVTNVVRNLRKA